MKNVLVTYNSFVPSTDIKIDGRVLKAHTDEQEFLERHRYIPVFDWIEEFIGVLREKYRASIKISFEGTGDACEMFREVTKGLVTKVSVDDLTIGTVTASLPDPLKTLDEIYQAAKNGPFPEIFTDADTERAYKAAASRAFEVSVIAAMSSGKSTLMNAFLGRNLMPSAADACTATIVRITDVDAMKGSPFLAERYDASGMKIDKQPIEVTNKELVDWNGDPKIPHVEIRGDVPTISETASAQYVFQDTPGPNNSRDHSHREMTRDAIAKPLSMVLYVMTPGSFQSNDNDDIFSDVCKAVRRADDNARNRFMFVLNKFDEIKRSEQPLEDVYKKACEYLESDEINIHNPIVIPVCARAACLIRLHRYDSSYFEDNFDDELEYSAYVKKFGQPSWNLFDLCKNTISPSVRSAYEKRLEEAKENPEELALLQTGIPLLESILQEYLYRYALPTKVGDALKTFQRVFASADKATKVKEILGMKEEDLKKFKDKLLDYERSKDKLQHGADIITEIEKLTYQISKPNEDKLLDLSASYEEILADVERQLGSGKVSSELAGRKCERARARLDNAVSDINETLQAMLVREQEVEIGGLIAKYNACLEDSLGKLDPSLRAFQTDMLSISSDEIVQIAKNQAKTTIEHKYYERHWYTLWCYRHEEKSYEDALDMDKVRGEIHAELVGYCRSAITAFKKQAEESFRQNQGLVVKRMGELQNKLIDVVNQVDEAAQSTSSCENECKKLQEKIDWCENFKQELAGLLKRR